MKLIQKYNIKASAGPSSRPPSRGARSAAGDQDAHRYHPPVPVPPVPPVHALEPVPDPSRPVPNLEDWSCSASSSR
ncbi:hypothetical protein HPB47_025861 [Ixodes persulcatus]|uniref:Uncharacterized protein n=1 Tax=Ixodes persulcatus TaxID=34615 RepID=A0AC60Q0R7_IXOPE|nr:hypothetical protein HPB47_025861 [Ixodes persulcatus]